MQQSVKTCIEAATSVALATTGPHGVNVVPISVVAVQNEEIHLYDFFMNKTAENIVAQPEVALTCWKEFVGVQIKASATYETSGAAYEAAVVEMKERFPERTLRAIIRLAPTAVHDVAPGQGGRLID